MEDVIEDVIKENFCNLCKKHKCKNCMKIYIENNKDILTYGCSNYEPTKSYPKCPAFNYVIKSDKYNLYVGGKTYET